jgi:formate-dependent nitrite reductase membrane component NrfD
VKTAGQEFAPDIAIATGEDAQMRVRTKEEALPTLQPIEESPADDPTYYGQPVIKEPVWIWTIPTYFFVGGVSGAVSMLALFAPMPSLKRAAHAVGTVADTVSAGLLVSDLGRPSRFLNMLRVVKPTSPMSIGSWALALSGATSAGAFLLGEGNVLGRLAAIAAGLLGAPLAGYTAVLLTNTAVPTWAGARTTLPLLFLASAAASGGLVLSLLPLDAPSSRVARRFAVMGTVAQLASSVAVDLELAKNPRARAPLHRGFAGACWTFSRVAAVASLAGAVLPKRARGVRRALDLVALAGEVALRFAVFHAGKVSARDPRATFHAQSAPVSGA